MAENKHKQKCEELRKIRVYLAEQLGLSNKIKQTPCEFKGECKGTCPACAAEEKLLNKALLVKTAAIAGATLALTGCGTENVLRGEFENPIYEKERKLTDIKRARLQAQVFSIQDELEGEPIVEGIEILPDDALSGDVEYADPVSDEGFLKNWVYINSSVTSVLGKYLHTVDEAFNESEGDLLLETSDGEIFYIRYEDIPKAVKKIERYEDEKKVTNLSLDEVFNTEYDEAYGGLSTPSTLEVLLDRIF